MRTAENVSFSLSMVSAGLSLLESLHSTASTPVVPTLDVLTSHPTMTTKRVPHSPPLCRKMRKGTKPLMEQPLKDVQARIGGRAKFLAIVRGDPQPLVTWLSDGIPIGSGGTHRYVKDGDRHIMLMPYVNAESGCAITCRATNQHGEAASTAKLLVLDANNVTEKSNDATKRNVNKDSQLDDVDSVYNLSTSEGIPEITLEISDVTTEVNRTEVSMADLQESALILLDEDSISVAHSIESSTMKDYFPPLESPKSSTKRGERFVHFSEDSLLQEYPIGGSDSSELCSETSSTLSFKHVVVGRDYDWTDEVRQLIREEIDRREQLRSIEEKQKILSGTMQTASVETNVASPTHPPIFTKPICDCFITAGETAHFVYILDANPPTAITWRRNDLEVSRNLQTPNIGIINDNDAGCLLISEAQQTHSGVYSCIAENIYGSAKCSATLIVSPNLNKATRSTSTYGEILLPLGFKDRATFKDQMSQTSVATENKAVNSECAAVREINDGETGEGRPHSRRKQHQHLQHFI